MEDHIKSFIFTAERYNEDVKTFHQAKNEIERLGKIFKEQPSYEPERYTNFKKDPGVYFKRKFNNNFRLILTRKDVLVDATCVRIYVALRVLKRGDNEYERFQSANLSVEERDVITDLPSLSWDIYIEQVKSKMATRICAPQRIGLTPAECTFIESPLLINHELFDITIYETKNWIKNVQEENFTDFSNAASRIEE
ncbi:MAG: hypothetical protein II360_06330, partial [Muribaculaceae bacterium]|nr:hypothetical protein [Muribaculaceae bacterium]